MMHSIIPETLQVMMERLTRRAAAAARRWSTTDLQYPCIDRAVVAAAMQRYLAARSEPMKPLRWFDDGTSARAYIRSRVPREPKPAYWPSIDIARALDIAWFAGAMRPPIAIHANATAAADDWEKWICAVTAHNAALSRDGTLQVPPELKPLDDGFPEPLGTARPIDDGWLAAVLAYQIPPPSRAVHPERLWTPLLDALAGGLYFFWNGPDEVVCIPRPALWLANGRLHRDDGPAVLWPSGERHFFRNGTEISAIAA